MKAVSTFAVLLLALVACSTGRTIYVEYDTTDPRSVLDSIEGSGTRLGEWREWCFDLEEEGMDPLRFTTLYDGNGKAKGSIQVRQEGEMYNIRITDRVKQP